MRGEMRKAFTALFLFLILNLCTSFSSAQVKIQERIELNPQSNTLPDSTNGLKNQVSLNKISNLQSTFNMPVRGKVKVEIISSDAAPSSRISLEIRQPEYKMLCEYGNHNVGFAWTSDIYEKNKPVEFGIDCYYNSWGTIYQGKEAGVRVTQINEDEYTMGFEAAGDDWDYNELIIKNLVILFF